MCASLETAQGCVLIMKENRTRQTVTSQMVGGILGMMDDPALFCRSDIGGRHEYSNWTAQGREALTEYVIEYSRKLAVAQDQDLAARAKDMTWTAIKQGAE